MTFIVGITGGIGSGKSTIEKMFEATKQVQVIDTDAIAHDLQKVGAAGYVYIREVFGSSMIDIDNSLNRSVLRNLVFNDKEAKAKLEMIMSPLIYHVVKETINKFESQIHLSKKYILLSVPLLLENKIFSKLVNRTLVVDCPEDVQIERVMKRNGMSKAQVERIIANQRPRVFRIMKADDVIHNYDCEPNDNNFFVNELHQKYLELAFPEHYD
jgi:dephospho-CoA kinase